MEMGPDLYKRLSEEMEQTLDAYSLNRTKPREDDGGDKGRHHSGLQPSRQGGAEKVKRSGDDGMTDDEHGRMVAIFKRTGMDKDNPAHRKMFLSQIRG
jgi:hypothetical protein